MIVWLVLSWEKVKYSAICGFVAKLKVGLSS
jgi:hypothetical protein